MLYVFKIKISIYQLHLINKIQSRDLQIKLLLLINKYGRVI